ncbi:MAG: hypothetical protein J0H00_10845 [Burkholderiales bacterium]|nr:hypothetical protein [Burkholderiales bacterium]
MNKISVAAKEEAKWRAESDLSTLVSAREIQKDAKRMAAVRALAREKMKALESLHPPKEK